MSFCTLVFYLEHFLRPIFLFPVNFFILLVLLPFFSPSFAFTILFQIFFNFFSHSWSQTPVFFPFPHFLFYSSFTSSHVSFFSLLFLLINPSLSPFIPPTLFWRLPAGLYVFCVWLMTRLNSGFDQVLPCVRIIAYVGSGRRGGVAVRCRCVGNEASPYRPTATLPYPVRKDAIARLGRHPRGLTQGYQLCHSLHFVYAYHCGVYKLSIIELKIL